MNNGRETTEILDDLNLDLDKIRAKQKYKGEEACFDFFWEDELKKRKITIKRQDGFKKYK